MQPTPSRAIRPAPAASASCLRHPVQLPSTSVAARVSCSCDGASELAGGVQVPHVHRVRRLGDQPEAEAGLRLHSGQQQDGVLRVVHARAAARAALRASGPQRPVQRHRLQGRARCVQGCMPCWASTPATSTCSHASRLGPLGWLLGSALCVQALLPMHSCHVDQGPAPEAVACRSAR